MVAMRASIAVALLAQSCAGFLLPSGGSSFLQGPPSSPQMDGSMLVGYSGWTNPWLGLGMPAPFAYYNLLQTSDDRTLNSVGSSGSYTPKYNEFGQTSSSSSTFWNMLNVNPPTAYQAAGTAGKAVGAYSFVAPGAAAQPGAKALSSDHVIAVPPKMGASQVPASPVQMQSLVQAQPAASSAQVPSAAQQAPAVPAPAQQTDVQQQVASTATQATPQKLP